MKASLHRRALAFGFIFAGSVAAAAMSACSGGGDAATGGSTSGNTTSSGSTGSTGSSTGTGTGPSSCATPDGIAISFAPMYSAYEPTHTYQLPAVVNGIDPTTVTWSASDPTMVTFAADVATGGTLLTMAKSGTVTIIATAGGLCGSSELSITAATPEDWTIGNARYNDGVAVHFAKDAGTTDDAGGGPACTNCHGATADGGLFNDVAHTPEQTGGFSDTDLIGIVTQGVVPDGGYFDTSIISYAQWHHLHQWTDITADEQQGIVVYLRSLAPTSQNGSSNFGGHYDGGFPHDGGHHDGGGLHDAATD